MRESREKRGHIHPSQLCVVNSDLNCFPLAGVLVEGMRAALEDSNREQAENWALNISQSWILKHEDVYDGERYENDYLRAENTHI